MTIAELQVRITGDDSSAQRALERTSASLRSAREAAEATARAVALAFRQPPGIGVLPGLATAGLGAMLGPGALPLEARQSAEQADAYSRVLERIAKDLGEHAGMTRTQAALYAFARGELGLLTEAEAANLRVMLARRDVAIDLAKGERLLDELTQHARLGLMEAQASDPRDLASIQAFAKPFAQLTDAAHRAQVEQLAAAQSSLQGVLDAQRQAQDQAARRERDLMQWVASGGLSAIAGARPMSADELRAQQDLEGSTLRLRLERARLTATDDAHRLSIQLLGREFESLDAVQRRYLTETLVPLATENERMEHSSLRQREIAAELTREIGRQYGEIARAGGALGPAEAALERLGGDTRNLSEENRRLLGDLRRLQPAVEAVKRLSQAMSRAIDTTLDDLYNNGFRNFFSAVARGFDRMLSDMAREWLRSEIKQLLEHQIGRIVHPPSSGSDGGLLGGLIGSFGGGGAAPSEVGVPADFGFGGWFAGGGDVFPGRVYGVGERGPELFVPWTSGRILSSNDLRAALAGAGGVQIVQNVHFHVEAGAGPGLKLSAAQAAAEIARRTGQALGKGRV
ncbi:MAG: hypothetical protein HYR64_03760 [Fimbriimonas ginsengisoli]|uniref:Bacteriophage tail tape measure C-terminal domain-containing protein n=1 Tax=Fimbriimonas ginsengisoli TaxID=1005039 RepID=A0A931LWM2_FIMGI|nr:hypothetical protein [Fimbriimonas ginsengisoli]